MTDYTGLKRLCAALISANEAYLDDSCSLENQERFHSADDALQDALPPEVVLAIIAESELLRESPGMRAIRSLRGDCADLMAERDRLKAENETLRKDLESHKRMLLAAACDIGAIGKALKADMNADGDELLGTIIDLKAQNTRMLEWLKDIGRTSGDKAAVMGARQLLKEFRQ